MLPPADHNLRPRQAIEAECARGGRDELVRGCVALLCGARLAAADPGLVEVLGGVPGRAAVAGGLRDDQAYWLRVWAARGLLWAWDAAATPALLAALADEHWRVREMAAKVAARHQVGDALPTLAELASDPEARVAVAASRAARALASTQA